MPGSFFTDGSAWDGSDQPSAEAGGIVPDSRFRQAGASHVSLPFSDRFPMQVGRQAGLVAQLVRAHA